MRRRIVLTTAAVTALLAASAGTPASAEVPTCARQVPVATDGRMQLATPRVERGGEALALLSGFTQWPQNLVGGGSGETFLSCTPWQPGGAAEVMPAHEAALLLMPVPRSTAPGRYDVSVLFREGSRTPSGVGRMARLTVSLVVTATPPVAARSSPVCDLPAPRAPLGLLQGPSAARPGAAVPLRLVGVPAGRVTAMNEYDRLWWLACTGGSPTVSAHSTVAPARLTVAAPTATGSRPVTVIGILDGRLVRWTHPLTVTAPTTSVTPSPTPSPSPSPTTTAPTAAPATEVDEGGDRAWLLLLGGSAALVGLGAGALVLARRRARGR